MNKTIIDLGAYDETYAKNTNAEEIILVDLDEEKNQYKDPYDILKELYDKKKKELQGDVQKRIEEIRDSSLGESNKKIEKINIDAIDFFNKHKPKEIDEIHASYLFSNIDLNRGKNKNVEAQKLLILNALTALKEGGVFEIIEDYQRMIGEKDSEQMKLIKKLVESANKNQRLDYKFEIEKQERVSVPETVFEANLLNEERRYPGKIVLKKVKKTQEDKEQQKARFKIVKVTNPLT